VEINDITGSIVDVAIDVAIKVHTALGPGLLESVYESCLRHELVKSGLRVHSQVWLPVIDDETGIRCIVKSLPTLRVSSVLGGGLISLNPLQPRDQLLRQALIRL